MIAVIALAVLTTTLVLFAAAILTDRPEARHAAPRHWQWPCWLLNLAWRAQATPGPRRSRRPVRLAWLRLLAFTADWVTGWRKASGLTPRDEGTVAWLGSLHTEPVRSTAAALRIRAAVLGGIIAGALEGLSPPPDPQRFGDLAARQYDDDTGTFTAITGEGE
jgi:hypothetical protein